MLDVIIKLKDKTVNGVMVKIGTETLVFYSNEPALKGYSQGDYGYKCRYATNTYEIEKDITPIKSFYRKKESVDDYNRRCS